MKNKIGMCLFILMLYILASSSVFAEDGNEVMITSDIEGIQSEDIIRGNAIITFNTMELYNESIKFSYHIQDENGNDLAFENERIPVILEGNTAVIPFSIDKSLHDTLSGRKKFKIVLDMVDEQNLFWFSLNPYVHFSGYEIEYEYNLYIKFLNQWKTVFGKQKIQIFLNLSGICLFLGIFIKYKREYVA